MALKTATRSAQWPLVAEFVASFNDTAKDSVTGALKTFGSVFGDAIVFDAINIPPGAVVMGGEVIVETQGVGPTAYTVAVGIAGTPAAYLAATDLKAASGTRVALTGLGLISNDGQNVRITIASSVANATAGKFRVRIHYTVDGKANEVVPA